MKVGDLVRHRHDGDIGIITEVSKNFDGVVDGYEVHWYDGTDGYHFESELEVYDEGR